MNINPNSVIRIFLATANSVKSSALEDQEMSDDALYKLNARADITFDILRKIQQEGYTLVRTPDPEKRKELTLILKQIGIKLS